MTYDQHTITNVLLWWIFCGMIIIASCGCASPVEPEPDRQSVMGNWNRPYLNTFLDMELRGDGHYQIEWPGVLIEGTWQTYTETFYVLYVDDNACEHPGAFKVTFYERGWLGLETLEDDCLGRIDKLTTGLWIRGESSNLQQGKNPVTSELMAKYDL